MKVQKIASSGTVAVKHIEIATDTPITLISGRNRAGKSSLRDGIVQAFTGEHPKVKLKKNYPLMINQNDGNSVGYTYIDYDGGKRACITLPNGTHELTDPIPSAMEFLIDPAKFGSITPDERGSFLFNLANLRSDGEAVNKNLVLRGLNAEKIEAVAPFLKSSFETANKHALDQVKQSRADWKAVTGETYGDKKAEGWKAPMPQMIDAGLLPQAEEDFVGIDKELAEENQKLGAMKSLVNGEKQRASEIARMRESADKEERIRKKLDVDRNSVAEWKIKIEETRKLAMGSKPGSIACACPGCGVELIFTGKALIARGGDLHGDEYAAAKLPEYEETLKMLNNAVSNDERDLAAATAAREQLALMKDDKAAPTLEEIAGIENKITLLKASRANIDAEIKAIKDNIEKAAQADEKTKKAAAHHINAQEWDKIADALAPDGIPGEMLGAALKPINERIKSSVEILGFAGNVHITDDMTIMEDNDKLYSFSSKATKLLIDSMIAEAISHVSGIKFMMIDEFDLLDLPSRGAYLKWLITLARAGEIDSALLFGTLKEKPAKLPPEVTAHWIHDGVIDNGGVACEVAA